MGINRLPIGDDETLGRQRLQSDIIGAGRDRALDPCAQQLLERRKQDVLEIDSQRQQPVEEGSDWRLLVLDAVVMGELHPGRILERLKRTIPDLAGDEQQIELAQRVARVVTFEIVFGAEQALPAGLALSLGDGTQRVETPRDRREKALLGLHIGGDGPEQRRLRLVGGGGAAQSLNSGIGLPSGLQRTKDRQAPGLCRKLRVIGTPGTAGVGENEDGFDVIHECLGFAEVGGTGAGPDSEVVDAISPSLANDTPRAPWYFLLLLGSEA